MTKVNYPIHRLAPAASSRQRRWLLVTFAALAGCTLFAATYGAEQSDSGWVIASPSPLAKSDRSTDLHQQLILRQLLDQMQPPLLRNPSSTSSAQTSNNQNQTDVRFAVRPDGAEGWRPTATTTLPLSGDKPGNAVSKTVAPHLTAPERTVQTGDEAEYSWAGQTPQPKVVKKPHQLNTAPALADIYGNLSEQADSAERRRDIDYRFGACRRFDR
jgi:hypothetical protein